MRYLTVLYDRDCQLCRRARAWLDSQPKYVPLRYIAAQSDEAKRLYPTLADSLLQKFTVISDEGAVYREEAGWLMCLYALKRYRRWARKLAAPGRRYLLKLMVSRISRNRLNISDWLGWMLKAPPVLEAPNDTTPLFCNLDGECGQPKDAAIRYYTQRHMSQTPAPPRNSERSSKSHVLPGEWFD